MLLDGVTEGGERLGRGLPEAAPEREAEDLAPVDVTGWATPPETDAEPDRDAVDTD